MLNVSAIQASTSAHMSKADHLSWAAKLVRDEFHLSEGAITSVQRIEGGRFNLLVHVRTQSGDYVVKRFLSGTDTAGLELGHIPPARRMMLAASVQRIAGASFRHVSDHVLAPAVHRQDYETSSLVMDAVAGAVTLQTQLLQGEFPRLLHTELPTALAAFHTDTAKHYDMTDPLQNSEIKALRLNLQYEAVAERAGGRARMRIEEELASYRATQRCVVHGDLSSRNILVAGDVVAVVDFEHAHIGEPVFDVACLLSDLLTSYLHFKRPFQRHLIVSFLDSYARSGALLDRRSLATHTATQMLHRFWSPNAAFWRSFIPEETASKIVHKCEASLSRRQSTLADLLE